MKSVSDEELVRRVRAGEGVALTHLISRYTRRVAAYACRLGATDIEAEQITSHTTEKLATCISQYQGKSRFSAWVLAIARNYFHRLRRNPGPDCVSLEDVPALIASVETEPEEHARRDRDRKACAAWLSLLSPDQRLVMDCLWLQGMSLTETAAVTGKSAPNVSQIAGRAMKSLWRLAAQPGTHRRVQQEVLRAESEGQ
ncbi:MAG: sigma-70 family RNA polymerase sigma factor [candidate division WOR-3 bacterium]